MSKSIIITKNGGPDVLELQDVEVGSPGPDDIKVTNHAIGLNYKPSQELMDGGDPIINLARITDDESIGTRWKMSNEEKGKLGFLLSEKGKKRDVLNIGWSLNPNSNIDFTYYKFLITRTRFF